MSDSSPFGFGKFIPGFDFLQNLASSAVKGASDAAQPVPSVSQWVAPTLSVDELDKRIAELKAVQFWLDQNAAALKATIQALEVQKMTLATLQGMNVSMAEVAKAFQFPAAGSAPAEAPAPTQEAEAAAPKARTKAAAEATPDAQAAAGKGRQAGTSEPPPSGVVDPLQWWGALTQQFQQIAASALRDPATQQAFETAQQTATGFAQDALKAAADMAASAQQAASPAAAPASAAPQAAPSAAAKQTGAKKATARKAAPRKTGATGGSA